MVVLEKAAEAWRLLNGVFCVYKPTGMSFGKIRHIIGDNLAEELNSMEPEETPGLVKVLPPEEGSEEFRVTVVPDYRLHPLVVGPGYKKEDFCVRSLPGGIGEVAGVVPCSVGSGWKIFDAITGRNPLCAYHIQAKFGLRTDDYLQTGRIIEKTTYGHIRRGALERFLSFYQGQFQKQIIDSYGVRPDSQEAYEMSSRGLLRPGKTSMQLLYNIKCIDFHLPYFTLELHCINETDRFLLKIINDIAEDLKTSAVSTRIRRIRYGNLTLEHALLRKHWFSEGIIKGISVCGPAVLQDLDLLEEPYLRKVGSDVPEIGDGVVPPQPLLPSIVMSGMQ